jgi:hypothetical protein
MINQRPMSEAMAGSGMSLDSGALIARWTATEAPGN